MSRSTELFERAKRCIPGGVNSPVRSFKHIGVPPIYMASAEGAFLTDVDGKRYVDFCLAFGPHLLGHSPPSVVKALQRQAALGTTFGACHAQEVELAERILESYSFLDQVRLVNSGTEAVMTAARIARGFTGRSKVVQFEGCYHGHSDGFLAKGGSGLAFLSEATSKGVPASVVQETVVSRLDDLAALEQVFHRHGSEIAAVVLEPVPANNGLWIPSRDHLSYIVDIARRSGALVIFDEVITGFRLGPQGACGYFDLQPDLVTLGKIVGGGLPLAAVVGRRYLMEQLAPVGGVYQAGTLSGNPMAVASGCAALDSIQAEPPYDLLSRNTEEFARDLSDALGRRTPVAVSHVASLFWIHFGEAARGFPCEISPDERALYAEFFKRALDQGVYLPPSPYEVGFISTAHSPQLLVETVERLSSCVP